MPEDGKNIDRRHFLSKSASLFAGCLWGFNSLSKVCAFEQPENRLFPKPKIAIIIDDIGYSISRTRKFLEIGVPLTFSILPRLMNSHELAGEIHSQGHEIMLHQPMEPYDADLDPGPGALYAGDEPDRIIRIMDENISGIPFAIGVNNHMGSKFTACEQEMERSLGVVKEKGLFFIDSLTSNRSKAYKTAKKLHMVTGFRNIFLDNKREESAIIAQLHRLTKHALKYGCGIGIGHPFPETAGAIDRFSKKTESLAFSLVHISGILHQS
ncbi:MAG: divergent polysaccharide deacetylase family protein [Desulfobacterales bacterium]|nr:divergent polysaccharide deacetylase family protein [Desulfobacterales bacterium]